MTSQALKLGTLPRPWAAELFLDWHGVIICLADIAYIAGGIAAANICTPACRLIGIRYYKGKPRTQARDGTKLPARDPSGRENRRQGDPARPL